jgi:hypothetical protein
VHDKRFTCQCLINLANKNKKFEKRNAE